MEIFLIRALQLILCFSILIILHEGGHFLFAKLFKVRVEKFCKPLKVGYVGHAGKPGTRGFHEAMARYGVNAGETAMLGDKLLTDTLGARRSGVLMLMVEPRGGAVGAWNHVLHALQQPFKAASAHDERKKH